MSPDKVCELLHAIGANVSRRTLLHYETQGLISKPQRGGGGRTGRFSEYPDEVVFEAYAAWSLIHGECVVERKINMVIDFKYPVKLPPQTIAILKKSYDEQRENEELYRFTLPHYEPPTQEEQDAMDEYALLEEVKNREETPAIEAADLNFYLKQTEGAMGLYRAFLTIWEAECQKARYLLLQKGLI